MQVEPLSRFRVRPLPKPGQPPADRRTHRSNGAADALRLALDAAVQRAALDLMVVVDRDGMLVAHSQTELDLSMLAAVVPLVSRGRVRARIKRAGVPRELTVRALNVCDEQLYVAALGGTYGDRMREVASSASAARRILG